KKKKKKKSRGEKRITKQHSLHSTAGQPAARHCLLQAGPSCSQPRLWRDSVSARVPRQAPLLTPVSGNSNRSSTPATDTTASLVQEEDASAEGSPRPTHKVSPNSPRLTSST
ncbi:unnamed protein product, partial [Ixodes persulcatus]